MRGFTAVSCKATSDLICILTFLAVYAIALPPISPQSVSAHGNYAEHEVGLNPDSSTYPHLDWWNQNTAYATEVNVAKVQWNALDRVIIGNTVVSAKTDVFVFDWTDCTTFVMGRHWIYGVNGAPYGQIGFNTCMMSWAGGTYPVCNCN